jgi:AraC-like DNA-binding protein
MSDEKQILPVNYSCYFSQYREGEQFVSMHGLGMVADGFMELDDGDRKMQFTKGMLYAARKNHLLKFNKHPADADAFKSVSVYFDDAALQAFSLEYGYQATEKPDTRAFIQVPSLPSLVAFMHSLQAYEPLLNEPGVADLLRLKQKEALLLLLQYDPSLKDILFDFSEPGKIDLASFMQKNYHFNVHLERFAYLTGRSLSTFKRDFEKIFHETPSRWLLQRRLKEAYYLIKEKGRMASDIYLDLGFEDLSHFSHTFKKAYGVAPSKII